MGTATQPRTASPHRYSDSNRGRLRRHGRQPVPRSPRELHYGSRRRRAGGRTVPGRRDLMPAERRPFELRRDRRVLGAGVPERRLHRRLCAGADAVQHRRGGVETCDASGNWGDAVACVKTTCMASADGGTGASCGGQCLEGATQCASATTQQTCSSAGMWGAATACNSSQTCVAANGVCGGVCGPTQTRCDPSSPEQPQTCGADGQWHDSGAGCGQHRQAVQHGLGCVRGEVHRPATPKPARWR